MSATRASRTVSLSPSAVRTTASFTSAIIKMLRLPILSYADPLSGGSEPNSISESTSPLFLKTVLFPMMKSFSRRLLSPLTLDELHPGVQGQEDGDQVLGGGGRADVPPYGGDVAYLGVAELPRRVADELEVPPYQR